MSLRTPHFPDLLFDSAERLRHWETKLLRLFAEHHYREIRPSLVLREPMASNALRFFDQDELVGLRWDFTESLARMLVSRFNDPPPRIAYAGAVFRKSTAPWEAVERWEVGCERVQSASESADASDLELARLLMAVPAALGLKRSLLHLGDAALWRRPLEAEGISDSLRKATTHALHQRSPHRVRDLLQGHAAADRIAEHAALLTTEPDGLQGMSTLTASPYAALIQPDCERLASRFTALETLLPEGLNLRIDLADVADLDFYTGPTLRLWAPGATTGLAAGGRYDRLYPELGKPWQAAGFCVRLSTLLELSDNRPDLFESLP